MKTVEAPIRPNTNGENVANLQDTLSLMVEKKAIDVEILGREEQLLPDRVREERRDSHYGAATAGLVKIFRDQNRERFALDAGEDVDDPTAKALNRLLREFGALDGPPVIPPDPDPEQPLPEFQHLVRGVVRYQDGLPIPGLKVMAFDKHLRHEDQLGEPVTTDADGLFEIFYSVEQMRQRGQQNASLIVRVFGKKEGEEAESVLAESDLIYEAAVVEKVVLRVPAGLKHAWSEFEQLMAEITPLLEGAPISSLTEDEHAQELSFLSGKLSVELTRIAQLVGAHKLGELAKIEPEVIYGLIREKLPFNLSALLSQSPERRRSALIKAVRELIVPGRLLDELDQIEARFQQVAAEQAITGIGQGNGGPLAAILSTTRVAGEQQLLLAGRLLQHKESAPKLWEALRDEPQWAEHVDELQVSLQLGTLTAGNVPLMQRLHRTFDGGLKSVRELTRFDRADWKTLVSERDADGKLQIPAEVSGKDDDEKITKYASILERMVQEAFPVETFAQRIQRDEGAPAATRTFFQNVLSNNVTLDLRRQPVEKMIEANPALIAGVVDKAALVQDLKTRQRLFKIVPVYEKMEPLLKAGLKSSADISRMGRWAFANQFAEVTGGTMQALKLHAQASYVTAGTLNLFAILSPWFRLPTYVLPEILPPVDGTPDWEELFGTFDLCRCQQCRSVHSPAAYLTELFAYLKERKVSKPMPAGPNLETNVRDLLFERRPDLGDIELTCDNTNIALPYVNLVAEALENAIAPFVPFALPATAQAELDAADVSATVRGVFEGFQHKLTDDTVAVVIQPGESWLLTDHRRLYSIRQDAAAGAPRVMALGNQTSGTEPDLAANPSHVNAAAYVELSEAVHPWLLPLDLPTEETRVWLRQTGVERAALMAAFQPRSGTLDPGDLAIAGESLDLTAREVGIVTAEESTPHHPWEFCGLEELNNLVEIPDPADPSKTLSTSLGWVEALAHVPILLRQSALSYGELLALLNTRLINPAGALRIESVDPRNRATCDLHLLRVTGLDETALDLLHRFTRLRRRLGWTVRELDLAIQVFQGNEVSAQARLSSGLIRQLAVSKRLEPELGLTRPRLLALWGNIDTRRGLPDDEDASSLYEQLFLNPLVLKPVNGAFLLDGAQTELATMGTPLVAHEPALLAGLGITASELDDLKSAGGSATLSLNSLSILFREVALAQGMGLAIAESLRWQQLLGLQPFAPTHPEDTVKLVETVQQIRAAGFSLGEVDYLLRHQFEPDDPLAPASDSVIQVLTELRAGLQKIESDSVIEADPTGEQTRKYLGLLKWDPAHVELVVGTLNAQPSFSTPLDELPPGFAFPAALVSKVVWDAASHTLSVNGPLDATDQAALMAVALPAALQPAYNAAVGILAGQSAIFLQAVRAYQWPVFRTALALASMPANALIPRSLKTRFFYDRIANEVAFSGLMLAQDFEELKRIAGADATFLTALESLRNAMAAYLPSSEEAFFSPAETAALLAGGVGPAQRFQTVLAKLVPRLERLRDEALVRQQLSTALAADADVLAQLLEPATMDELLAPEFAGSHASLPIDTSRFPTLFDAFTRLGKGVLVTSRLRMNVGQLSWYLRLLPTVPTRPVPWTVAAAPAGWLDLRHLPLAANPAAVPELAAALLRLIALCQLRDQLRPGGEFALEEVFDAARLPVLVADPGKLTDAVAEILSRTANFEESDTKALLGAGGLGFVLPDSLQDETGLTVLLRCFQLARKVNASPANARAWAREAPGATIGAEIKQAQRARYGDDAWDKLAIPGQDALREKKRSALVAYLTTRPFTVATPTGTRAAWKDADGLFAYFLIDVEMSACWKTSRIKQAISSVQLFVQRCLLNLEPGVHLDAVKDDAWSQWEWMKNYRVWEANRLVFLYPENWIEPELRDDKTPFFKDLENELQQNEITTDTAEEAFLHYLEKLDAVAKLELIGMYQQDAADGLQSVLHVFGRTMGTPSAYYYRSRTGSGRWTAWEKVDLDVEGDHVIPIVWNRRLYLFWAIFTVKATGTVPPKDSAGPPPSKYFEIQLGWSERKGQKWLPKKVTKQRIRSGIVPRDDVTNDGRQKHTFFTSINPDGLRIWPEWDNPSSSFSDLRQDNYGQTPTIPTTAPTDTVTTFFFSGCAGDATLEQNRKIFGIFNPNATSVNATRFEEDPFVSITGGGGPTIFLEVQRSLYLPPDNTTNRQEEALAATPGSALYEILYPHQDYFLSGRRPFFFEDQTRAFLVEPEDAYFPNLGWQDTAKIDAGKYKLIVDHYYELAPKSSAQTAGSARRPGSASAYLPRSRARTACGRDCSGGNPEGHQGEEH